MKLTRVLLLIAVIVGLCTTGQQAMAQASRKLSFYSFTGSLGSETAVAADSQPANGFFKPFMRGDSLLTSNPTANVFAANGWGTGTTPHLRKYFTFGFKANAGYKLRVDSITFVERRSNTGPISISVRSSLDNFVADVDNLGLPNNVLLRNRKLRIAAGLFASLDSVNLRIYGYGTSSTGGTWRIDNVIVYGAFVIAGPFVSATPSSLAYGNLLINTTSTEKTYALKGKQLTAPVVITAPAGYQIALPAGTFGSTLNIPLTGDSVDASVRVTFNPTTAIPYNGTITNVSGSFNASVAVTGSGVSQIATFSPILPYKSRTAATGVADSVGKVATVRGIVYGVNVYNPITAGVQFTIIDATAGINVRMVGNTSYTVTEGDEVEVIGTVAQFRGLIQLNATAITRISQGNAVKSPIVVTRMDYPLISDLIRINGLRLVPGTWPATPSGSGFTARAVRTANLQDTIAIRVVPQATDIWASAAPGGVFDLIAIGGQFTTPSASAIGGFQISPRRLADIIAVTQSSNLTATPTIIPTFGQVLVGSKSPQFFYTVRGGGLTVPVTITAPAGFEITLTNGTFVAGNTTVTIPLVADSIRSTRVYTRFAPTAVQAYAGVVTNVSGPNNVSVNISGVGVAGINAYTIRQVTTRNALGVGDSIGIRCTLRGKVYGVNTITRLPGAQFTLIDYTGGINVRIARSTSYTVLEGDSISVTGLIAQFRGLIQIAPDTITLVSSGNTLRAPRAVNKSDLSTVSDFVVIEPLVLVAGTWPAAPSRSFNAKAVNTITNDTTDIRILLETADVFQSVPPIGPFRLFALGTQFSPSTSVSLGGYQVSPRTIADIVPISTLANTTGARNLAAYPNPTSNRLAIVLPNTSSTASIQFVSMTGQVMSAILVDAATLAQGISVNQLPSGVYQAVITQGNETFRAKFIKE